MWLFVLQEFLSFKVLQVLIGNGWARRLCIFRKLKGRSSCSTMSNSDVCTYDHEWASGVWGIKLWVRVKRDIQQWWHHSHAHHTYLYLQLDLESSRCLGCPNLHFIESIDKVNMPKIVQQKDFTYIGHTRQPLDDIPLNISISTLPLPW